MTIPFKQYKATPRKHEKRTCNTPIRKYYIFFSCSSGYKNAKLAVLLYGIQRLDNV